MEGEEVLICALMAIPAIAFTTSELESLPRQSPFDNCVRFFKNFALSNIVLGSCCVASVVIMRAARKMIR